MVEDFWLGLSHDILPLESQGCAQTPESYGAPTGNGELDCEEQFYEFDKKCIRLELWTAPFWGH